MECQSSGRECDGPKQGAFFVDMTVDVQQKVHPARVGSHKEAQRRKRQVVNNKACGTAKSTGASAERSLVVKFRLPNSYQPEKGHIFQQLYLAHFISAQDESAHSWISQLPVILEKSLCRSSPEIFAVRATTMALYGRMSGSKQVELDASNWYALGLESQRKNLFKFAKPDPTCTFITGAVCAAIMFASFESIISTSPFGWLQHFRAAEKMLSALGPAGCQKGLLNKFFRSMRVASVRCILFLFNSFCLPVQFSTSLTLDEPSVFASENWLTIPFDCHPKEPLDRLLDILLQLPSAIRDRNDMRCLIFSEPERAQAIRRRLANTALTWKTSLHRFWDSEGFDIDPQYAIRLHALQPLDVFIPSVIEAEGSVPFLNAFSAYVTSMYDVGNIIVLGYLAAASLDSGLLKKEMIAHGNSILLSASYQEEQGSLNGGSFSMIFPLKIVCLLSPSEAQRALAQDVILNWGTNRGLTDICTVAAPTYQDRSHG